MRLTQGIEDGWSGLYGVIAKAAELATNTFGAVARGRGHCLARDAFEDRGAHAEDFGAQSGCDGNLFGLALWDVVEKTTPDGDLPGFFEQQRVSGELQTKV